MLSRPFGEYHGNHPGMHVAVSPDGPHSPNLQERDGSPNLVCDGTVNNNSGCGILEWSRASYGEYFASQGGGVFATKWDENEITACAYEPMGIARDVCVSLVLRRVVLSCSDSTGHHRWHTEPVVMGGTGRETIANSLQSAKRLLRQHVHHFRLVLPSKIAPRSG